MAKDPREQVFNGSFDTGAGGWFSAGADMPVVDGKLRVQVPGGRRQPFDVIVGQNDIPLERSAQYTIAFTASASRPVTIRTQVQLSDEPYTATWSQNVGLDTSPKQYQFSFTSNLDTDQGQVSFQIGGSTAMDVHARRRVAARRRLRRGVRAGHRTAGAGQPGRLPARRPEERHRWSPTPPRRCPGS